MIAKTRNNVPRITSSALLLLGLVSLPVKAEVRLPAIFSDNMVLQRDLSVPVWGWADPGESVTVEFAGQKKIVKADKKGRWIVHLDPMKASTSPASLAASGNHISNVLVGDVWLCSGQSNMAMSVRGVNKADQEIAQADFPNIRMFMVQRQAEVKAPTQDCGGDWKVSSPATAGSFSATAFFFGRHLHKELDVPIGLINSSWGGTRIEAWTSKSALEKLESGRVLVAEQENKIRAYDLEEAQRKHQVALDKWQQDKQKGKNRKKPRPPASPLTDQNAPSALFNGMISPLIPYALKGATWYQGERNTIAPATAFEYRNNLPAMITDWRSRWKQGDFPFFFVQLPNFETDRCWPIIRESFLQSLSTPNTGMAITIDIGMASNIHPKNKQDVGKRLALSALHVAYGRALVHSGPIFKSMRAKGNEVTIQFEHTGGGLVAKGERLTGFTVSGEDRNFVPADARIEDNRVVVSGAQVERPVAVRYAWANFPDANLFNKEGLPASPFRTDDWNLLGDE